SRRRRGGQDTAWRAGIPIRAPMNQYPPPNMPYAQPPPQGYPQQPPPPTAEDDSQLNTLAICHFIYAGMLALFGVIGLIYVVFGVILATASLGASGGPGGP